MSHVVVRRGIEIDLSIERHTACPRCRSNGRDRAGNNLRVYGLDSDGDHQGGFCWACGYTIMSAKMAAEQGDNDEENEEDYEIMGSAFNQEVLDHIKRSTGLNSKNYRGVRRDISEFFKVRYQYSEEDGSVVKTLYPCTENWKPSGYKVRSHPKDFKDPGPIGETGKNCELFGQIRFKDSKARTVVITSGEHDTMAAYQMLYDYQERRHGDKYEHTPVVSPTIGEAGAHKQIQKQYEWFNRFEKIIYIADRDDAGHDAVKKIAKVLPKGKLFVMTMNTVKDPNQALEEGKESEFIDRFFKASAYTPDGIVGSGDLMDKIIENAKIPKIPLPPFMHKLQGLMAGGIPLKTTLTMGSMSGAGKSTMSEEMVFHWIFNSPHRVGIVSLESDCGQYGTKLLSRMLKNKIDLIEDDDQKIEYLQSKAVERKAQELFTHEDGSHRFHLIDERDGGLDSLKEQIEQLIISCDCKVVILDPLTDILDGMSNDEQALFMKWIKGMLKSHDVTFILISHVRKSAQGAKANSAGAELFEEDFHGSSSIFKSSACNLLFTRNKDHENPYIRNVTKMKMSKCRWTGQTAPEAGLYYYDNKTHTLHDLFDFIEANPELAHHFEEITGTDDEAYEGF